MAATLTINSKCQRKSMRVFQLQPTWLHTKSGFIMNPNEWGTFLGGHHFRLSECNIELDKKNGGGGGGDSGYGVGRESNGGVGGGRGDDSYEQQRR